MNSGELSPPHYGTRAGKSELRPQLSSPGLCADRASLVSLGTRRPRVAFKRIPISWRPASFRASDFSAMCCCLFRLIFAARRTAALWCGDCGHPRRRAPSPLTVSKRQAFEYEDCLLDLRPLLSQIREHLENVHARQHSAIHCGGERPTRGFETALRRRQEIRTRV